MRRHRESLSLALEELPAEVRAAVEAMLLGEEVELRRGGRTIGSLSFRSAALEGVVVPSPRLAAPPPELPEGAVVVATVVPMTDAARGRLSEAFGDDYVVLDVNSAPDTADVVLTHPVSPQLLELLRARFSRARVVVTEVDDDELGVRLPGPVARLLDAGASAYLPPRTLEDVAVGVRAHLEAGRTPELTAAPVAPNDDGGGYLPGASRPTTDLVAGESHDD